MDAVTPAPPALDAATLDRLLAPGRALLADLRAGDASAADLAYAPAGDGDTRDDRNRARRARVLVALQLDPAAAAAGADHALARALLTAETAMHRDADHQGLASSLPLASVLVARARDVDDVWLQAQAKYANFDTGCGLDGEAMFAGGIAATLAHVAQSDRAESARLLADLTARAEHLDEASLEAWFDTCATMWPSDPDALSLEGAISMASAFGDRALLTVLLDDFDRQCARTDDDLGFLFHQRVWNHELDAAARLARERADRATSHWDRVGHLRDLADLEARLGRPAATVATLAALRDAIAALAAGNRTWPRIGLGWSVLALALDIWDLPDPAASAAGERLARELVAAGINPPPISLERLHRRGLLR